MAKGASWVCLYMPGIRPIRLFVRFDTDSNVRTPPHENFPKGTVHGLRAEMVGAAAAV